MSHNIQVITYTYVTCNEFSELRRKIIPSYKFLKFVNQVTIKFWFRNAVTLKRLQPNIKFGNQLIVAAIKFRKMFLEVYETDSRAGEVWLLNIYFAR